MGNGDHIDLAATLKKLLAQNKSQQDRLEEYETIVRKRDNEIEMLHTMLSEANEYRSSLDNQLKELKDLQRYIGDLQQQVSGSVFMASGRQQRVPDTVSVEQQLHNLNLEYTYLQSQLTDLQTQLLDVNNRNLLLQQQNSRVAELESILENIEKERDARK